MKRQLVIVLAIPVIVLAVLVTSSALRDASAWEPVCGTGDHWVDSCAAGPDEMDPTSAVVGIDDPLDSNLDCTEDISIVLSGPVEVDRLTPSDDSATFPGTRTVDSHDDVIDTEILSMVLESVSGITLKAGTATPGIDGAVPASKGAIAELSSDAALAESFFEVFFEVSGVPIVGTLWNHAPLIIEAPEIDHVPPDTTYIHPTGCLPLYDDPVAGTHVANLVSAEHITLNTVGGILDAPLADADAIAQSADGSGSSFPTVALAGLAAAAVAFVAGGGWYARRRWLR